jgi:hypothetical protein
VATADEFGDLAYDYRLNGMDGEYTVRAYPADWAGDWNASPIAEVKFVDAGASVDNDFKQCANYDPTSPLAPLYAESCHWINSI